MGLFWNSKEDKMLQQQQDKFEKDSVAFIDQKEDKHSAELTVQYLQSHVWHDFDFAEADEIYESIVKQKKFFEEERKSAEEHAAKTDQIYKDIRETAEAVKRIEAALVLLMKPNNKGGYSAPDMVQL